MFHPDLIELFALYGFRSPWTVYLDTGDVDWLELYCDDVAYTRRAVDLPRGLWREQGYVFELADTLIVARNDPRARDTARRGRVIVRPGGARSRLH